MQKRKNSGNTNGQAKEGAHDEAALWLQRVATHQDKQAFASLFHYFAPRVKAYLRRQGLEAAQAEDLAQDIMLQIWSRAASFDPLKARASTWIYTIARNRMVDFFRQKKNFVPLDDNAFANEESYEPQTAVETSQDGAVLRQAVADLPPAQRTIVEENFFNDQTHRMIAQARKIPLGTVKSRLRLALDHLRQKMKRED